MGALGYKYIIEYVDGTIETLQGDSRIHDGVLTIRSVSSTYPIKQEHIPLVQIKRWTSSEQ